MNMGKKKLFKKKKITHIILKYNFLLCLKKLNTKRLVNHYYFSFLPLTFKLNMS